MGDLSFLALDENGSKVTIELKDVRLAPDVDVALISASQLIGAGFEVILGTRSVWSQPITAPNIEWALSLRWPSSYLLAPWPSDP